MSQKFKLQYYKSHDDKREIFDLHVIETDSEFTHLFRELLPAKYKKGGIWRGTKESSFKLYNTFQRENLLAEEPIVNVIGFVRELEKRFDKWDSKNIVHRFFNNFGIEYVPLYAKLSILRHYEVPSPLLDWTRNPNVALYFAAKDHSSSLGKNDLNNYFSLYFIDKEHPFYRFNSKLGVELFESNKLWNIFERYRMFKRLFPSKKTVNSIFNSREFLYSGMIQNPIQRISDEEGDYVNHLTLTNLNITAQNGLFILNAYPNLPLEEAIIARAKSFAPDNSYFKEALKRHINNFICIDIHKRFIPQIQENLKSVNVNVKENNILFDFNQLKKDLNFESIIMHTD